MTLASRQDTVMQRPDIYSAVWGGTMRYRDRSVDVVVRKIRGKLELWAPQWRYIHTHFAIGYRFQPERIDATERMRTGEPVDGAQPTGPLPDLSELRAV